MTPASIVGLKEIQKKAPGFYIIKEIFYTIQGEGPDVGRAAIFIRFSFCNLACVFCDTEYDVGGVVMSLQEIVHAVNTAWVEGTGMRSYSNGLPIIVLTGGEPSLQVDHAFMDAFPHHEITMETNGISWNPAMERCATVVVSPKRRDGWWSSVRVGKRGNLALKVVYDLANIDLTVIMELARKADHRGKLYLQPLEDQATKTTNVAECIRYVQQHPEWRLCLQTHKILGLR